MPERDIMQDALLARANIEFTRKVILPQAPAGKSEEFERAVSDLRNRIEKGARLQCAKTLPTGLAFRNVCAHESGHVVMGMHSYQKRPTLIKIGFYMELGSVGWAGQVGFSGINEPMDHAGAWRHLYCILAGVAAEHHLLGVPLSSLWENQCYTVDLEKARGILSQMSAQGDGGGPSLAYALDRVAEAVYRNRSDIASFASALENRFQRNGATLEVGSEEPDSDIDRFLERSSVTSWLPPRL